VLNVTNATENVDTLSTRAVKKDVLINPVITIVLALMVINLLELLNVLIVMNVLVNAAETIALKSV